MINQNKIFTDLKTCADNLDVYELCLTDSKCSKDLMLCADNFPHFKENFMLSKF